MVMKATHSTEESTMKIEKEFKGRKALESAVLYSYKVKSLNDLGVQDVPRMVAEIPTNHVLVFQLKGYDYKHIYVVTDKNYIFNYSPYCSCLSGDYARPCSIKGGTLVEDINGKYTTKAYIS